MTDQPTTSQEQPARLTKQREQEIRETYALHLAGDVMAIRNLLDELDAVRAEVQAAEARAERVRTALREIDSLSSSGFCAVGKESKQHYIMLMGNAAMDALREAFADPSPPASAEFPAHVYAIEVDGRRFADADAVKAYLLSDDTEPPADEQTPPARRTVAPRFRHLIEPRQTPLGPEPKDEMPLEDDEPTARTARSGGEGDVR